MRSNNLLIIDPIQNPGANDVKAGFLKKLNLAKTTFDYTDENKDSKLKVK